MLLKSIEIARLKCITPLKFKSLNIIVKFFFSLCVHIPYYISEIPKIVQFISIENGNKSTEKKLKML